MFLRDIIEIGEVARDFVSFIFHATEYAIETEADILGALRYHRETILREGGDTEELEGLDREISIHSNNLYYLLNPGKKSSANLIAPPKLGEHALLLVLPKNDRINIAGDLAEEYEQLVINCGRRSAHIWYWKQVMKSVWPMFLKVIRSRVARIGKGLSS